MLEKEAIEKGIDIESLKSEQEKLAKLVSLKDAFDFGNATRFAGVDLETLKTKEILATIAVLDENMELVEEKYAIKPARFPYIPGFRAYRELPCILAAYEKLEEQPDVFFIEANGIAHPRGLGLASHLGISINKPVIGITNHVLVGEEKGEDVVLKGKIIAKKIITKQGSKPFYVSPGHLISIASAVELVKKCVREPHKLPEPLVMARKIATKIRREIER
ncbi:MAG: endonuclease V [Candidatus Pacearchaeota archaeon]|nr:endonuclease V [Candidatus Pacearchaeota archaeon]